MRLLILRVMYFEVHHKFSYIQGKAIISNILKSVFTIQQCLQFNNQPKNFSGAKKLGGEQTFNSR